MDRKGSILIVDDSPDFRLLIHHYLKKRYPNHQIDECEGLSDNDAVQQIMQSRYDVILLDYLLDYKPGERNGLDILGELRQLKCKSSVILMTAHGNELVAVKAIKGGAFDYISKQDFNKDDFLDTVSSALSRSLERQGTEEVPPSAEFGHHMLVRGYRPLYRLGRGGQALTYLAEPIKGGEKVVLKLLPSNTTDKHLLGRFLQEYEMISALEHPHIVQLYSQGVSDNTIFIVMEYLRNGSLREKMAKRKLHAYESLEIIIKLSQALHHMHEHQMLHRDIKATNIMFRDNKTPVLIDFGAAKHMLVSSGLTLHGEILGTPHYMSPEQAMGEALTPSSDIYSLGVVFYEMLTGELPYIGDSIPSVIAQHRIAPIPLLPAQLAQFQRVIDRMLAKRVDERYTSAKQLNEDLQHQLLSA